MFGDMVVVGTDPVFVGQNGHYTELRIGEAKRGETRYALLSASDARLVAYALLASAEQIDVAKRKKQDGSN